MVTFDNFCAISLAIALEHHSANQVLKAATTLNVVQPKLFQATRQDDLRFSDCSSFKFLTMQMYLGRGIADLLSATTIARRQAVPPQRVLTILPPVAALTVGLPAKRVIAQRFSALARLRLTKGY